MDSLTHPHVHGPCTLALPQPANAGNSRACRLWVKLILLLTAIMHINAAYARWCEQVGLPRGSTVVPAAGCQRPVTFQTSCSRYSSQQYVLDSQKRSQEQYYHK